MASSIADGGERSANHGFADVSPNAHPARLDREMSEDALYRARFSLDFSSDLVMWIVSDGHIVDVNQPACTRLGYSRDELLSKSIFDIHVGSSPDTWPEHWYDLKHGGPCLVEEQYRSKSGEVFPVEISSMLVEHGGREIAVGVIRDISERKRVEKGLRASEDRYETLVNLSPNAIIVNVDGRYAFVNPAAAQLLGASAPRDLIGQRVLDRIHPDYRDTVIRRDAAVRAGGAVTPQEIKVLRLDGTPVEVEVRAAVVEYDGRLATHVVFQDISERLRSEELLRLTQFSVDHATDSVFWTDCDANLVYVSDATCRMHGYSRDEMLAMTLFDVDPSATPSGWQWSWDTLKATGVLVLETTHRTKAGDLFPVEVHGNYVRFENKEYNCVFARDIRERKRAEAQLAFSQKLLRELNILQESLLTPVSLGEKLRLVTDTVVRVVGADFARIWMVRPGDRCDTGCPHASATEESRACRLRDQCLHLMASSGRYVHTDAGDHGRVPLGCYKIGSIAANEESGFLSNDLPDYPFVHDREWARELGLVSFAGYRLADTDAKALGVLALFSKHEISPEEDSLLRGIANATSQVLKTESAQQALRAAEELLRQSQKMEAVGQLAGGIAHDFNNLLAVILGYSELLLSGDTLAGSPGRPEVEQIERAAKRASALTAQILAFSRRQALRPQVVCPNDIIKDMEPLLRRTLGEDIDLQCRLEPGVGGVEVDVHQFEQVIMNLALNARDAMSPGGRLTLQTAEIELDEEFCRTHPEATLGRNVTLMVSDTGTGMDRATLGRIFEPFFTTKPTGAGTGLGLATVYGIIRQSGGGIFVESELGRGTSFKICLPRVVLSPKESVPKTVEGTVSLGEKTVLVVDDEDSLRDLMVHVLEKLGCNVLSASTALEALEAVGGTGITLDCLVTDVVLPGDVQGNDLAHQLTLTRPDLPVLYVSGYTRDALVYAGRLDPGVNLLEKPFSPARLGAAVRDLFDQTRV